MKFSTLRHGLGIVPDESCMLIFHMDDGSLWISTGLYYLRKTRYPERKIVEVEEVGVVGSHWETLDVKSGDALYQMLEDCPREPDIPIPEDPPNAVFYVALSVQEGCTPYWVNIGCSMETFDFSFYPDRADGTVFATRNCAQGACDALHRYGIEAHVVPSGGTA